MLKKQLVEKVRKQVIKSFPELRGVKPRVRVVEIRPQHAVHAKLKTGPARDTHAHYVVCFKTAVKAVDGHLIAKIVRVAASDDGSILKITTSR